MMNWSLIYHGVRIYIISLVLYLILFVLQELLKPLKNDLLPLFREVLMWERPATTLAVIITAEIITYK